MVGKCMYSVFSLHVLEDIKVSPKPVVGKNTSACIL